MMLTLHRSSTSSLPARVILGVLFVGSLPGTGLAQTSLREASYTPADAAQVEVTLYELCYATAQAVQEHRPPGRSEVVFTTQAG